jgi:hypothetical protein
MASHAMCLERILTNYRMPAYLVFPMSNGLQMGGIDTPPHTTKMIQLEAQGNWAMGQLPCNTVSNRILALVLYPSVAASKMRAGP